MANQNQKALPKQMPMVGWYDPRQLAKTGVEVAVSTIFGRHSDHRLVEAMASEQDKEKFYDYSYEYQDNGKGHFEVDCDRPRNSIWIDYVGDVGDGWNSTYAVAYNLGQAESTFKYTDSKTKQTFEAKTKRGAVLIFGGDEVYPTASREVYDQRLVAPYETALRYSSDPYPHVFALPGNHDWYDSLVAFTRLFTARPWFAGWRTRQTRSYFALKLPHNWWLLGTDVQLGSDIDKPQMQYFEGLVEEMDKQSAATGEPARIIVCHAEPHWIRAAEWGGNDPNYNESNLKLLEKRLGQNVAVFIAGDLHHYRRHESEDKSTQKITAGGGGAFMHPTHTGIITGTKLDVLTEKGLKENEERKFHLQGCFPSTRDSFLACFRNLGFPFFVFLRNKSWSLGIVMAALYLLLTAEVVLHIGDPALLARSYYPGSVIGTAIQSMYDSPLTFLLVVVTFLGFLFFTDTHKKWQRFLGGGLHALSHIFAAFYIALLSVSIVGNNLSRADWLKHFSWPAGFDFSLDTRMLFVWLLILLGGFVFGTFIMGFYLLISLNFFGRHGNEAFSSLGIEDWKNFLRLQIDEHGDLTIYPVGIRRVPRKWKARAGQEGPELVPDPADRRATPPELIEMPIVMKRAATETGVKTTSPSPVPAGASAGG